MKPKTQAAPRARKPYTRPQIAESGKFERLVLACGLADPDSFECAVIGTLQS